jgi:hypothetical protein
MRQQAAGISQQVTGIRHQATGSRQQAGDKQGAREIEGK